MWPESSEKPQPLRSGLTTGTCATACTVAAARLLLSGNRLRQAEVILPRGQQVRLRISGLKKSGSSASAFTIKDAGDDPDVTHGAEVGVTVTLLDQPGVRFRAAEGVGTVTRAGLPVAVGEPAINPVPRQMMTEHLQRLAAEFDYHGGFELAVGIKDGAGLALKTMNPRLGIEGGLSVLGTTGIVRPFSCAAYIASIHQAVDVARANGLQCIAAVTGSSSEAAIRAHYGLSDMALVEMGDFAGAVLKHLRRHPVEKVVICGGFGKISKLACGHLDLHSRASSVDFNRLADWVAGLGGNTGLQQAVAAANTTAEVLKLCGDMALPLAQQVCREARQHALATARQSRGIEVWVISRQGVLLTGCGDRD